MLTDKFFLLFSGCGCIIYTREKNCNIGGTMDFIELLKAILFGIVEGITEWLPVSSTGHIILLDEFIKLKVSSEEFKDMFDVVIQLGAILAVVVLFFNKLNPLAPKKTADEKKNTWLLWAKVVVAVLPSAVIGVLFEDFLDTYLYSYIVVALALILYGVAFILVEKKNKDKTLKIESVHDIDFKTAIFIGCFQCLSLIPGTSRSGSTILGAILLGVGRSTGAEFSFFLAIPTMLGASALKTLKFILEGVSVTSTDIGVLVVGCVVSFIVSLLVIKGLMDYVRKHNFSVFGWYRIVLGILVVGYFVIKTLI